MFGVVKTFRIIVCPDNKRVGTKNTTTRRKNALKRKQGQEVFTLCHVVYFLLLKLCCFYTKDKSEPISNKRKVRIYNVWCG